MVAQQVIQVGSCLAQVAGCLIFDDHHVQAAQNRRLFKQAMSLGQTGQVGWATWIIFRMWIMFDQLAVISEFKPDVSHVQ